MNGFLNGRTVGFVVAQHGVEERELTGPREAAEAAGARTVLLAPAPGEVEALRDGVVSSRYDVDRIVSAASGRDLDALVLPDGESNSRALRGQVAVEALISEFAASARPIGAFGHAVWSLLDAGVLRGRAVTSHPSLEAALVGAGARWHDRRVVVDDNIITSRASPDIDAFNTQLIAFLDR